MLNLWLYERRLANGSIAYEANLRLGRMRRFRLQAQTKTYAIAEVRALQVDHARGEAYRSLAAAPTVAELAADWIARLGGTATRSGDTRLGQ